MRNNTLVLLGLLGLALVQLLGGAHGFVVPRGAWSMLLVVVGVVVGVGVVDGVVVVVSDVRSLTLLMVVMLTVSLSKTLTLFSLFPD